MFEIGFAELFITAVIVALLLRLRWRLGSKK